MSDATTGCCIGHAGTPCSVQLHDCSSRQWHALNDDLGSAQDVLVVQQDAAVVVEYEHVVAAPSDGAVSDGDHLPCQPDESGCEKDGVAVCRLECVLAGLDEHGIRLGHPTIDL